MPGSLLASQVKKRVALSSVVKNAVQLRGNGPKFLGLCPFHQEKTPSFHVQDNVGRFKCFGCGAAGDVFEFIMRLRGLSFKEAVAELAGQAGLNTPAKTKAQALPSLDPARELLQAQKIAHQYFIGQLRSTVSGSAAREYLMKSRHMSAAMIEQAGIGFGGTSADEFFSYLRQHGISKNSAIEAGLVKSQGGGWVPMFLRRIIFPIRRFDGKVIAFGGRSFLELDADAPKYVNTHAHILYEKRKNFYGLFESKAAILKGQTPVLVEGYFDAMAMWAAGVPALALCGTALSAEHTGLLKRLSNRLTICFDDDQAGFKAVRSALALLWPKNISANVVIIDKKDPGEYLADLPALQEKLRHSQQDALCYVIDRAVLSGEGDISRRILEIDLLMPIFLGIARPLIRRQYVVYLAKKLHEDPSLLWAEISGRLKNKRYEAKIAPKLPQALVVLSPTEKLIAQILGHFPKLVVELTPGLLATLSADFRDYLAVPGLRDTPVARAVQAAELGNLGISAAEAQALLKALDQKVAKLATKAQVKLKRQELQQAEKAKDFGSMLKSLKEQSQILAQGKAPKALVREAVAIKKKPCPTVAAPAPDYSEEEDWM